MLSSDSDNQTQDRRFTLAQGVVLFGSEFLCSALWPLCFLPYTIVDADYAFIIGGMLWLACALGIHTLADTIEDRNCCPVIVAGRPVGDIIFGTEFDADKQRYIPAESRPVAVGRLAAQWTGALLGYGLIMRTFPFIEAELFSIWSTWETFHQYSYWAQGFLQLFLQCFITFCQLMQAYNDPKIIGGPFKSFVQSGLPFTIFIFPTMGLSWSLVSYMWLQHAYKFPSVGVIVVSNACLALQGVLGRLCYEMFTVRSARNEAKKNKVKNT